MGERNLRIDLIEPFANMIDGVLGEGVRHSTPSWAGVAPPAHPQSKVGFSLLPTQFFPELSSKRIQIDLFDSPMGQVLMPPFGNAFGFPHQGPVGGFVASASKSILFHKGFKKVNGMVINFKPISGNPSDAKSQYFRGETLDIDPGKHEETGVVGHQMQVVFPSRSIPTDEGISCLDLPGGGAPAKAGHRPILQKGNVFEMSSYNLPISQIVMLLDKAVVKRLQGGVSNQLQSGRREVSEGSWKGTLVNGHPGNGAVSYMVVGTSKRRRKSDKPSSLQGQKELSAGHVSQLTIGLHPIPLPTEHPRDLLSSPAPMGTNDGLDLGEILFRNGFSANRKRQHIKRIAKQFRGRHKKMHTEQKNSSSASQTENDCQSGWVENEKGGLKIARRTGL